MIIDAETGDSIRRLEGATCKVTQIKWSPDGSKIAAASADNIGLHIWDLKTGELIPVPYYENIKQEFHSISWKPDSTQLVVTFIVDNFFSGMSVAMLDATTGESQKSNLQLSGYVKGAEWSPDGNLLLVGEVSDDGIQVNDAETGEIRLKVYGTSDNVQLFAWSPDGENFASVNDQTIQIWETVTGNLVQTIPTGQAVITDLVWNPNGETLASSGMDKTVKVWDTTTGEGKYVYQSTQPIYDLDWNVEGSKLVYSGVTYSTEGGDHGTYEIVDLQQEVFSFRCFCH